VVRRSRSSSGDEMLEVYEGLVPEGEYLTSVGLCLGCGRLSSDLAGVDGRFGGGPKSLAVLSLRPSEH